MNRKALAVKLETKEPLMTPEERKMAIRRLIVHHSEKTRNSGNHLFDGYDNVIIFLEEMNECAYEIVRRSMMTYKSFKDLDDDKIALVEELSDSYYSTEFLIEIFDLDVDGKSTTDFVEYQESRWPILRPEKYLNTYDGQEKTFLYIRCMNMLSQCVTKVVRKLLTISDPKERQQFVSEPGFEYKFALECNVRLLRRLYPDVLAYFEIDEYDVCHVADIKIRAQIAQIEEQERSDTSKAPMSKNSVFDDDSVTKFASQIVNLFEDYMEQASGPAFGYTGGHRIINEDMANMMYEHIREAIVVNKLQFVKITNGKSLDEIVRQIMHGLGVVIVNELGIADFKIPEPDHMLLQQKITKVFVRWELVEQE